MVHQKQVGPWSPGSELRVPLCSVLVVVHLSSARRNRERGRTRGKVHERRKQHRRHFTKSRGSDPDVRSMFTSNRKSYAPSTLHFMDRPSRIRSNGNARKLIGHLDQAVLAKAFRGELVPQDPQRRTGQRAVRADPCGAGGGSYIAGSPEWRARGFGTVAKLKGTRTKRDVSERDDPDNMMKAEPLDARDTALCSARAAAGPERSPRLQIASYDLRSFRR